MGRVPCRSSKEGMRRGAWTATEDELLVQCIKLHGEGKWSDIPKKAGLKRCGKSCRLRWMNYLRPNIKRGNMSPEEEDLIIRLHKLLGNRWSLIAGRIPGRTDNEIKNYWNTNFAKKCLPRHRPPTPEKNPVTNSAITSNPPNPLQFSTVLAAPPEPDFEAPPPPTQPELTTHDNTLDIVMDLDFGEISVSDMLTEDFLNFNHYRPSDSRNLGACCDTTEASALFGQQEKENSPNLPAGDSLDLPQYYMSSDFSPLAFLFESEGLDWS